MVLPMGSLGPLGIAVGFFTLSRLGEGGATIKDDKSRGRSMVEKIGGFLLKVKYKITADNESEQRKPTIVMMRYQKCMYVAQIFNNQKERMAEGIGERATDALYSLCRIAASPITGVGTQPRPARHADA
jgi:hypothetical protein